MQAAPKKPQAASQRRHDVIPGDEVYVNHASGPMTGRVLSHGEHGCWVESGGKRHKVPWQHLLGHKRRARQEYSVVDEGEDGMLVQDRNGRRQYLAVPPEAREEKMMVKSAGAAPRVALLMKSAPARPGLTQKPVTDKNGVQTSRWVRATPDMPKAQQGRHVGFENGEHKGHGRVLSAGADGAIVQDSKGGQHAVRHERVTHHWHGDGEPDVSPHDADAEAKAAEGQKKEIKPHEGDPDSFSAHDFARQHDDPTATADSIVEAHGGDVRERIEAAREKLKGIQGTIDKHKVGEKWSEERAALHRKLLFEGVEVNGKKVPGLLSAEKIKAATPAPGEKPTFIALGGRGGSGKSSLNGRVYEESRAIVVDPDHIKGILPEYQGWNAHEVHEESSEVAERVIAMAKMLGLNIVLDATMKSGGTINRLVDDFNAHGYRTEAHYMHLPRQEATKRAIGRFLNGGEKGRFVPPEIVMGNTENEKNFDSIKGKVHAWSFHDNQGGKDEGPKLIAKKGEFATVGKPVLQKSLRSLIIVMSKRSAA